MICFLCGKEFGRSSLEIHLKQCMEKYFNTDDKAKNRLVKAYQFEFDELFSYVRSAKELNNEEQEAYNKQADDMYKNLNLESCPGCGKRFLPEKLDMHLKGCKKKGSITEESSTKLLEKRMNSQLNAESKGKDDGMKKPQFLMCFLCGREFSKFSLEIHLKKCYEKYSLQEINVKCEPPDRPEILIKIFESMHSVKDCENEDVEEYNQIANKIYINCSLKKCHGCGRRFKEDSLTVHLKSCVKAANSTPQQSSNKVISRPRMLMCPLCGREFGSLSLEIHMKTCKKKYELEQAKYPKNQRKSADSIIEKFMKNQEALKSGGNYNIESANNDAYQIWSSDALVPCENCGRTFLPDRLVVHKRSCKVKK
jgi:zinc-finger of a C2HC-type